MRNVSTKIDARQAAGGRVEHLRQTPDSANDFRRTARFELTRARFQFSLLPSFFSLVVHDRVQRSDFVTLRQRQCLAMHTNIS
jgi:hypothetical protein